MSTYKELEDKLLAKGYKPGLLNPRISSFSTDRQVAYIYYIGNDQGFGLTIYELPQRSEPQTEGKTVERTETVERAETRATHNTDLLQFMHDAVGPTNRIKALAQMLTGLNPTQTKIVDLIIQSANEINTELDSYYSRNKSKN